MLSASHRVAVIPEPSRPASESQGEVDARKRVSPRSPTVDGQPFGCAGSGVAPGVRTVPCPDSGSTDGCRASGRETLTRPASHKDTTSHAPIERRSACPLVSLDGRREFHHGRSGEHLSSAYPGLRTVYFSAFARIGGYTCAMYRLHPRGVGWMLWRRHKRRPGLDAVVSIMPERFTLPLVMSHESEAHEAAGAVEGRKDKEVMIARLSYQLSSSRPRIARSGVWHRRRERGYKQRPQTVCEGWTVAVDFPFLLISCDSSGKGERTNGGKTGV